MKVCVYCASSPDIHPDYFRATEEVARHFAEAGVEVVFGGGGKGLMGQLADTMLEHGGKIKGIMPRFMNEVEWGHKRVEDFEYTETMHERKAKFLQGIDGILTLPGGTGTFEEFFEALTLKRLGIINLPIVVLNTRGYYDVLRAMLEQSVREGFMDDKGMTAITFVDDPEEVLPAFTDSTEWDGAAIRF